MRRALAYCVLFVVGVVVGYLLRGQGADHEAVVTSGPPTKSDEAVSVETTNPVPAQDGGSRSALRDFLEAMPQPSIPESSGTLRGTVRTEDGDPLAGVLVRAHLRLPSDRHAPIPASAGVGKTLEDEVRQVVAASRRRATTLREARTGELGEYSLDRLVDGPHVVEALLEDYEIEPALNGTRFVHPGQTVDFLARLVRDLEVRVVLEDGSAPHAATITYRGIDRRRRRGEEGWLPEDRILRLSPGIYSIRAMHGPGGELRSDEATVEVEQDRNPEPVILQLKARPGIRGRILFPEGDATNAIVFALPWRSNEMPTEKEILTGATRADARKGDGYGFQILDLTPGRYILAASRAPERVEVTEEVEVPEHVLDHDVTLGELDPGTYLVLWAYGPQGEAPLRDLTISTSWRADHGSSTRSGNWELRSDGSYLVFHHWPSSQKHDDSLRYYLKLQSRSFGSKEIEYTLPGTTELTVRFSESAFLDLYLVGYEGSGMEGIVHLYLQRSLGDDRTVRVAAEGKLDATGQARFGPSEAGEHELVFMRKTSRSGASSFLQVPITLVAGENRRTIEFPRFHALTILVDERFRGQLLRLGQTVVGRDSGHNANSMVGLDQAEVDFGRVPEGEYSLTYFGEKDAGHMRFTVSGPTTVRFEPQTISALHVSIDDPSGYLAGVGLLDGDLIVGLDGKDFENYRHMTSLWRLARQEEEVRLKVHRGGELLEVPFEPKMRWRRDELGGRLENASR